MILREIHLHGALAGLRDGPLRVNVDSAAEAWRACEALVPGFCQAVSQHAHAVLLETEQGPVTADFLSWPLADGQRQLHITPVPAGADFGASAIAAIVVAVVAAAVAIYTVLTIEEGDRGSDRPSSLFDGPVSVVNEGGALPVVYGGPIRVGPTVISGGIEPAADGYSQLARVVDLLCEGPIEGLASGGESVFIASAAVSGRQEYTPWQTGGVHNFEGGLTVDFKRGLESQNVPAGFHSQQTDVAVNEVVIDGNANRQPVIRQVQNANTDRVRVVLRIARLLRIHSDGRRRPIDADFNIEVEEDGAWVSKVGGRWRIGGLWESPREFSREFAIEKGTTPRIRVSNLGDHTTTGRRQNYRDTTWVRLTEIVSIRQDYRHTALAALTIPSAHYQDLSDRAYEIKGLQTQIPGNYDPVAKTYADGDNWDGAFKAGLHWHSNPAWAVYDLLGNRRYGLGRHIPAATLLAARWDFYAAGRWMDERVDDGQGGTEPRYSLTASIAKRDDAGKQLARLLSAMGADLYDQGGALRLALHRDAPPSALVTNASVKDGEFKYGSNVRERYSAVQVTWNDPQNGYRQSTELVVDDALVQKYGHRTKSIAAYGCTSRGQAYRHGRHFLISQEKESRTCTYTAGPDHARVQAGDILRIADSHVAGARLHGRVQSMAAAASQVATGFTWTKGVPASLSTSVDFAQGGLCWVAQRSRLVAVNGNGNLYEIDPATGGVVALGAAGRASNPDNRLATGVTVLDGHLLVVWQDGYLVRRRVAANYPFVRGNLAAALAGQTVTGMTATEGNHLLVLDNASDYARTYLFSLAASGDAQLELAGQLPLGEGRYQGLAYMADHQVVYVVDATVLPNTQTERALAWRAEARAPAFDLAYARIPADMPWPEPYTGGSRALAWTGSQMAVLHSYGQTDAVSLHDREVQFVAALRLEMDGMEDALGPGWTARWPDATGAMREAPVAAADPAAAAVTLAPAPPLAERPPPKGLVLFESAQVQASLWRVKEIKRPRGSHTENQVVCQEHYPARYQEAETGVALGAPNYVLESLAAPRPASVGLEDYLTHAGPGQALVWLLLSVAEVDGADVLYEYQLKPPGGGWQPQELTPAASLPVRFPGETGVYRARVRVRRGALLGAWRESADFNLLDVAEQRIYRLTAGEAPPAPASTEAQRGQDAYVPAGWSSAAPAVTEPLPVRWASRRRGRAGAGWSDWSAPAVDGQTGGGHYIAEVSGLVHAWRDHEASGTKTSTVTFHGGLIDDTARPRLTITWRFDTDADVINVNDADVVVANASLALGSSALTDDFTGIHVSKTPNGQETMSILVAYYEGGQQVTRDALVGRVESTVEVDGTRVLAGVGQITGGK